MALRSLESGERIGRIPSRVWGGGELEVGLVG